MFGHHTGTAKAAYCVTTAYPASDARGRAVAQCVGEPRLPCAGSTTTTIRRRVRRVGHGTGAQAAVCAARAALMNEGTGWY